MFAGILVAESGTPAHGDPCDFTRGGSPEACADSPGMREMEEYACDQWGTDCGVPVLYDPEVVAVSVSYQEKTEDGYEVVTREL